MNGPGRKALTAAQVAEIVAAVRKAPRGTQKALARAYGVSNQTITRVVNAGGYKLEPAPASPMERLLRASRYGFGVRLAPHEVKQLLQEIGKA